MRMSIYPLTTLFAIDSRSACPLAVPAPMHARGLHPSPRPSCTHALAKPARPPAHLQLAAGSRAHTPSPPIPLANCHVCRHPAHTPALLPLPCALPMCTPVPHPHSSIISPECLT
ncbi:hypothetical protein FIBSPDRAFT_242666 [Athelia psychrophila]|uniref:Uncharacterized protein n=1 Tax=Athelia psychrophila TaxID=1759441 RepID=A0A165Y362_9AGAM|nr:hypothetical protein FIBSPDRAFT_242666 [Fibularhizoctonia sp. CBS 109695]